MRSLPFAHAIRRAFEFCVLAVAVALAVPAAADPLSADEALEIVGTQWFEGIPEERISPLTREAVEALAETLTDVERVDQHAAAIELLGRAGGPGAREAVVAYSQSGAPGDLLTTHEHRARLTVPLALGHLARSDDAALDELTGMMRRRRASAWRTERLSSERVELLEKEMCAAGLGLSGRAAARLELQQMRAASPGGEAGARWRRSLDDAMQVNASRASTREGGVR